MPPTDAQQIFQSPGRCAVIGEVAQTHDGSLGLAHAFIDAIAAAGADAVKFQTHIASAESTIDEPWRVRFSLQDETRYAYWRRMEFSETAWAGLAAHARERGLAFISSPFSIAAVDLLARIGVDAWKIASGEVTHHALLDRLARTPAPVLLSSGLSTVDELGAAVHRLRGHGLPVTVLQTTSEYPCPPERVGLNLLAEYRERFGCPVGLSDHSGAIYAGLAAVTLGAAVLEVHVTLSREMFGPDVPASITTAELRSLVDGTRQIERMLAHPVDKDAAAARLAGMRALFTRSIALVEDLPAGAILASEHLTLKKPGTGLPADGLSALVGRRLRHAVPAHRLLQESDLEPGAALV
ncbi:MAG: N-acetylneuraminate synthase family protein [Acidobacteria bacterium]|nr:N-acetylneuraminate synthase family protein [Acidobacteriota bacterium]